jgi:class 3 adenylate cyclase
MNGGDAMQVPDMTNLDQLAQQNRLHFPPDLEAQFQDYYFNNFLWINRIGLAVGLAMWSLFGIIDRYALPQSYQGTWLVRFGLVVPIILLSIFISYQPVYRRWMRATTILVTLSAGLGVIAFVRMSLPGEVGYYYYIYGLTVILMFLFTIPGAQFIDVVWVSLLLLACAPLAYMFHSEYLRNPMSNVVLGVTGAFFVTLAIVGMVGRYFYELSIRRNFIQRIIIVKEEEQVNALLLNVLPASIAERLKRGEEVADFYPAVSVLFADIVNFTPLSMRLTAAQVVHLLNHVFSIFDELTEQYTLEKIKTIGDAYMVVSGLPVPRPDHAEVLADLALDIQQAVAALKEEGIENLMLRIGIHTGPAVAGVIGWRKFAYDLWGDTINTASRMESHGLPGRIQVSQEYYELLKDRYRFEARGEIEVKGKGKMCTYLLLGRLPVDT